MVRHNTRVGDGIPASIHIRCNRLPPTQRNIHKRWGQCCKISRYFLIDLYISSIIEGLIHLSFFMLQKLETPIDMKDFNILLIGFEVVSKIGKIFKILTYQFPLGYGQAGLQTGIVQCFLGFFQPGRHLMFP